MNVSTVTQGVAPPRRAMRSVGAVLSGAIACVLATLATDMVLHSVRVFPPIGETMSPALFWLAATYRVVYGIAGSYITARLAPERPMEHALVPGVLAAIASTVGAALTWNRGPAFGPHWYPIVLIVTAMPCAWLGGRLRRLQLTERLGSGKQSWFSRKTSSSKLQQESAQCASSGFKVDPAPSPYT